MRMKKIMFLVTFATNSLFCNEGLIKPWTLLIYIAGDNDLEIFIDDNVRDMMCVGSNKNCNIVLCIARREGNKRIKKLKYVLVEKGKQKILFETNSVGFIDSGQDGALSNFCIYALEKFPAHNYGLIFWDHGTGPLDPTGVYTTRTRDAFSFAHHRFTSSLATLPLITLTYQAQDLHKALCFDDSTGNYLTEIKLNRALESLCTEFLLNKKFALIGFDTCLMAHVEIASLLKKYGLYMVASQEVEPGTGWNYKKVFSIFTNKNPSPRELGKHIVQCYEKQYFFADDLTLSCIDLEKYNLAEQNFRELIAFLIKIHSRYENIFIKSLVRTSGHKKNCTHFDEPEYIDLTHFLENLLYNFQKASINKGGPDKTILEQAEMLITKTLTSLQHAIIANTAGKDFTRATGLSIYFPSSNINKLYKKNIFCCATRWEELLQFCL